MTPTERSAIEAACEALEKAHCSKVDCINDACAVANQVLPILRAALDSVGWQDITTAPMDGTAIDLWNLNGRRPDSYFHNGQWCQYIFGRWIALDWHPTHWMPLPQPPKEGK